MDLACPVRTAILQAVAEKVLKQTEQVKPVSLLVHAFRMLILGGAAYAIVKTYGSFVPAVACGLTLAVTAATIEVLIELLYARA